MDTVRGFIKISGIAEENELAKLKSSTVFQFSEKDSIYIPDEILPVEE